MKVELDKQTHDNIISWLNEARDYLGGIEDIIENAIEKIEDALEELGYDLQDDINIKREQQLAQFDPLDVEERPHENDKG